MELQDEILKIINDNIGYIGKTEEDPGTEKPLNFLKYVSGTDLFQVTDYPAVIVREEPYDFKFADNGSPIGTDQECTIFFITESKNIKDMEETDLKNYEAGNTEKFRLLIKTISGVSNLFRFFKGDLNQALIGAVPVTISQVPVQGFYTIK